MIPTVELKQSGKGIGRSRGRPTGVVETKPRRKLKIPGEPLGVRALRAAETAAIRARRDRDPSSPVSGPVEPLAPLLSYGPEARLTRYSVPPPAKKRRLLSDKNKDAIRKNREMRTSCTIPDLMALGRYAHATDLVARSCRLLWLYT